MKKATLQSLVNYLDGQTIDNLSEIKAELEAELNKDKARKDANAQAYEKVHDVIVGNLDATPCTCAELYEAIKGKLPEGFGKGKVQYALTHLWEDEIVKIEGTPNTYRKA